MKYLKTFEKLNIEYLIFPLDSNIENIKNAYYTLKRNGLSPKIFSLKKTNFLNRFSSNLSESDLVIRFVDNTQKTETWFHKRSYILDENECEKLFDNEIKIKDLELYLSSKKYNL